MVFVTRPFLGYRVRDEYEHLLPTCEGRPNEYALSALYLTTEIEGYDEAKQKLFNFDQAPKFYPGGHPIF